MQLWLWLLCHDVYMYVEEQEVYTNGLFLFIVLLCKKKSMQESKKMDIGMVQAKQGIQYTGSIMPACFWLCDAVLTTLLSIPQEQTEGCHA